MQVTTEIGNRHQFVLKKALLIYEDQISKRDQFVTAHDVLREGAEPQLPRLGPGTLLTTAFLKQLCRGLERKGKTGHPAGKCAGLHLGSTGLVDSRTDAPDVFF